MNSVKCPYCAEEIQEKAIVCRYCGRNVDRILKLLAPLRDKGVETLADFKNYKSSKRHSNPIRRWFNIISLTIVGFSFVTYLVHNSGVLRKFHKQLSGRSNSTASSAKKHEKVTNVYQMNKAVCIGYTCYVANKAWWSYKLSDNEFLDSKPNAMFLFIDISVMNNDKKARTIPQLQLVDENGAEYDRSSKGWTIENSIGVIEDLNPGVLKQGILVFDVPQSHQYKLRVSGGYWSSEKALIDLRIN